MTFLIPFLAVSFSQKYKPHGPIIEVDMAGKEGSFFIETDPLHSPQTVKGILKLVKSKFYDGLRIHRVEDWVIQWGAPASRNEPLMVKDKTGAMTLNDRVGDGGSGKPLPFEESTIDFTRGVVGIASDGLQMGGDSQLFVLKSDRFYLYRSYAVVGLVVKGMDVVDHIKFGDRIARMVVLPEPKPLGSRGSRENFQPHQKK